MSDKNYRNVHAWINRKKGKASYCSNPNCNKESKTFEWALIKGRKHEKNPSNYLSLCKKCHGNYDKSDEYEVRNSEIRLLRTQRYTLKELGNLYSLSHERIRQICKGVEKIKLPVDKSE